jgi:hypothetical protein
LTAQALAWTISNLFPAWVLELEHGRDTWPPEQVSGLDAPLPHGGVLGSGVGDQEPVVWDMTISSRR